MGTPLALNAVSYLEEAVADIPTLSDLDGDGERDPLPSFLFVAITFHELLHEHLSDLDVLPTSSVLAALPADATSGLGQRDKELLRAHLHLFALRRWVYEDLGRHDELPWVEALERTHGAGYARAWDLVHDDDALHAQLLEEIRAATANE